MQYLDKKNVYLDELNEVSNVQMFTVTNEEVCKIEGQQLMDFKGFKKNFKQNIEESLVTD